MIFAGWREVLRAADFAHYLPNGSMVWREYGGERAWSDDVAALLMIDFRLQVLAWMQSEDGAEGRNPPKPPEPPKTVEERKQEENKTLTKAERFMQRQGVQRRA